MRPLFLTTHAGLHIFPLCKCDIYMCVRFECTQTQGKTQLVVCCVKCMYIFTRCVNVLYGGLTGEINLSFAYLVLCTAVSKVYRFSHWCKLLAVQLRLKAWSLQHNGQISFSTTQFPPRSKTSHKMRRRGLGRVCARVHMCSLCCSLCA